METTSPIAGSVDTRGITCATRDSEVAGPRLAILYGNGFRFEPPKGLDSFSIDLRAVKLSEAAIARADLSGWRIARETGGFVNIAIMVGGAMEWGYGSRRFETRARRDAAVARPFENMRHVVDVGTGLALYVPVGALIERAGRLSGRHPGGGALGRIPDTIDLASPAGAAFSRVMKSAMIELLTLGSTATGPLVTAGLQDILLNLATACLLPDVGARESDDCGSVAVRRARDHIRAHAADPIEISRVASDHGMAMRTLQASFKRYFGYSPRDYLMDCRLETAREQLAGGDPSVTVTRAALQSGFSDLGHFAAKYREKFGELPSQTLADAKRRSS